MSRVYLDYNATAPLAPGVARAMVECIESGYANPSSVHKEGRRAREVVERARAQVAALLEVPASRVFFCGSATEANNAALRGVAEEQSERGRHVVISTIEHPSVLGAAEWLESNGYEVTRVGVGSDGRIAPAALQSALRSDTTLVSVMWANNETGALQPVDEIIALSHAAGALVHIDAVQAVGRVSGSVGELGADLVTVSGHKLGGPKGAAALYVRAGLTPVPLLAGGHQERGLRGGTENVLALVGFGAAAEAVMQGGVSRWDVVSGLRDRLWEGLSAEIEGVELNGSVEYRLPNTLNVHVSGCDAEALLMALDLEGFSASTGSACASGSVEPSHVLLAMGRSAQVARQAIRFSLGERTNADEVRRLVQCLPQLVMRTRALVDDDGLFAENSAAGGMG